MPSDNRRDTPAHAGTYPQRPRASRVPLCQSSADEMMAIEILAIALNAQVSGDFAKADRCFQQALWIAAKLSPEGCQHLDVFEMQFHKAILSPFVYRISDADATLLFLR
ncbi:hypothetical protein M433DRAFT_144014 [Acidomyces richmondensis BFW]|nr:MAG: hypothetical protein FE78DRAFT_80139 [Acidomyces sp. 'richmondensis']KYG45392.1 hypothetical protein M433DRAFT_144014 [Acidomyces richmondensis BFW]